MTDPTAHNFRLYIETVGCQMNMLDSELVVAALRKQGYSLTDNVADADTVLFNTCSVRDHAEHKIYSALGRLKFARRQRPAQVLGVIGCMAQKDQDLIFQRAPHVDLVVGTGQLHQIPDLIAESRSNRQQRIAVSLQRKEASRQEVSESFLSYDPLRDPEMRPSPYQAFVRIMIGCDKFCTYCVVPMTRGPEQSRSPRQIIQEVRQLADEGVKEIIFLGQTVNSYKQQQDGRTWRLSDLLHAVHDFSGLERLKFVTSYPRDMTDDLLQAVRDLPKACRYLHVPAQSGCDEVLRRMKRGYTIADYREMMHRINATLPGCAVSSDFIVGFPGESEEAFQKSLDLIREFRFKNSFIFKYSPRPGTKAHDLLPDDIPEEVKRRRNAEMLTLQNTISEEDNAALIGKTFSVLVEGLSKTARKQSANAEAALAGAERDRAERHGTDHSHDHDHDHRHDHDHDHGSAAGSLPSGSLPIVQIDSSSFVMSGATDNGIQGDNVPGDAAPVHEMPVHENSHDYVLNRFADASHVAVTDGLKHAGSPADSASIADLPQLTGRTMCDRIVVFSGNPRLVGTTAEIVIEDCTATTLLGSIRTRELQHGGSGLLPILA